jgi:hypothetical protein
VCESSNTKFFCCHQQHGDRCICRHLPTTQSTLVPNKGAIYRFDFVHLTVSDSFVSLVGVIVQRVFSNSLYSIMNLSSSCLAAFAAFATTVTSFVSPSTFISRGVTIDSTIRYISSWGTKGPPSRWTDDTTERKSPEDNIQSYLKHHNRSRLVITSMGKFLFLVWSDPRNELINSFSIF